MVQSKRERERMKGRFLPNSSSQTTTNASSPSSSSPKITIASNPSSSSHATTNMSSPSSGFYTATNASNPSSNSSTTTNASSPSQARNDSHTQVPSETTLRAERRIIDILLVAAEKLVGNNLFWYIVLIMIVFGMIWLVFLQISNIGTAIIDAGARGWNILVTGSIATFDTAIYASAWVVESSVAGSQWIFDPNGCRCLLRRATDSTLGEGALCASSLTLWLATWLHSPCFSLDMHKVCGTFKDTVLELDCWAEISGILLPHVNSFQLATMPLQARQAQLQHNSYNLTEKDLLVDSLGQYVDGLVDSADSMYEVTLATDSLLVVLVYNFEDVQGMAHEVAMRSKYWWFTGNAQRYKHIAGILVRLIDVLDTELDHIITVTMPCVQHLTRTKDLGVNCHSYATTCRDKIDKATKPRYFFITPDGSLASLRKLVQGFILLDTQSILDQLSYAKDRLKGHQARLKSTKAAISISSNLADVTDLQQLLKTLQDSLGVLSTSNSKLALSTAREREEYERQSKEGFFHGSAHISHHVYSYTRLDKAHSSLMHAADPSG